MVVSVDLQVTQKVPQLANGVLAGIPRTIDVKGLELNISLAGDPLVTPEALVIRDWGRFQNPGGQSSGEAAHAHHKSGISYRVFICFFVLLIPKP